MSSSRRSALKAKAGGLVGSNNPMNINKEQLFGLLDFAANQQTRLDPRIQLFSEYGVDTKHTRIYQDFGYQHTLTFQDFYFLYERFGLADSVISFPVSETWGKIPRITDNSKSKEPTKWEKKLNALLKRTEFWPAVRELDRRQRVGRWGGIYLEISDGKNPDLEPINVNHPEYLVRFRPLYEQQLQPIEFDTDNYSVNYGDPRTWQVQETNLGDRNEDTGRSFTCHPDRVVIWSEGSGDGGIYGKSALKPVFNALVTLFKLIGSGGEGFFKNARGSQHFSFDKDAQVSKLQQLFGVSNASEITEEFNKLVEEWVRGFDTNITTQGMTRETIGIDLDDPKPFFDIAMSEVAASVRYPMTVMIGQQTGRLASNEDQKQAAKVTKERQENFAEPALRKIIDRFIHLGFIEPADYEIAFADPFEPSTSDKLEMLERITAINEKQYRSGGATLDLDAAMAELSIDGFKVVSDSDSEDLGDFDDDLDEEEPEEKKQKQSASNDFDG